MKSNVINIVDYLKERGRRAGNCLVCMQPLKDKDFKLYKFTEGKHYYGICRSCERTHVKPAE